MSSQRAYDASNIGRYTDRGDWDMSTKVAISVLTDADILEGNPDGTFRSDTTLNRAEFVKIVMGLLPPTDGKEFLNCFPDVPRGIWYEQAVCRAKSLGIVRGNVDTSVTPDKWKFEPNRAVQYEEAVKVLVKLYAIQANESNGNMWYVPFINAASQLDLDIAGLIPGDRITRGEMARLTVNFLAYSEGDLTLLRNAERMSSSSSSRSSTTSSSSSSRTSSSSSSTSTGTGGIFDPLTDTSTRSNIALLGATSPILAGVKFYSNNEPMQVDTLTVNLAVAAQSVDAFLVYDSNGRFLGTATQVSGSTTAYRVTLPKGMLNLPYRADHSIYVRARLKGYNSGGQSGESIQVNNVQLTGTGEWSNDTYNTSSSDVHNGFETARAKITSITNVGQASTLVASGDDQILATFAFATTSTDSQARVTLQQLRFQISAAGGVTVSNVELRQEGSDTVVPCSIAGTVITCSSIPSTFGTITGTENFRVYGDVSVPSNANSPRLSIAINEPGTITTSGDITWTDGETVFTWVPFDAPVVRGTQFQ